MHLSVKNPPLHERNLKTPQTRSDTDQKGYECIPKGVRMHTQNRYDH